MIKRKEMIEASRQVVALCQEHDDRRKVCEILGVDFDELMIMDECVNHPTDRFLLGVLVGLVVAKNNG